MRGYDEHFPPRPRPWHARLLARPVNNALLIVCAVALAFLFGRL